LKKQEKWLDDELGDPQNHQKILHQLIFPMQL
jgi:hypothetical protein